MTHAFSPLIHSSKAPQISSFDVPISTVAEDLAPYVRSIAAFDLRLEEQRQQLSAASSRPGREGGKTRKTRASRAALEGGNKASTRRERWFPNGLNYEWVLKTGSQQLREAVSVMMDDEKGDVDEGSDEVASQASQGVDSVLDELR